MSETTETPAVRGTAATLAGMAGERFGDLVAASRKWTANGVS